MHTEYTPIGHTVNLASRLQSLANAGSTVISDSTRKLVEGYFALRPLGPTHVKGISEPINVHEVVGLGPLRTRLQRSAGRGLSKFVGRAKEKETLKRAAARAHSGAGQIVAVVAEPGVGKSRLFFEFKAEVQSEWTVLEAFSVSHGKGSAYLPIVELLHSYFRDCRRGQRSSASREGHSQSQSSRSRLGERAPLFARFARDRGRQGSSRGYGREIADVPDLGRRRPLALDRVRTSRPFILMVEDLHWLDDESQALLDLLADSIMARACCSAGELSARIRASLDRQILVLIGYGSSSLGERQARMRCFPPFWAIPNLAPLKQLIVTTTGGVPFFMEEMVQALFDEGALKRAEWNGESCSSRLAR